MPENYALLVLEIVPALKGVFAKNERGYKLNAIKKRFWSLLILLLSVASIRRKLLKTTNTEERSFHTNSERCNIQLGSLTNQFNSRQIIQILQPIIIDFFSSHCYIIVDNLWDFIIFYTTSSYKKNRRLICIVNETSKTYYKLSTFLYNNELN